MNILHEFWLYKKSFRIVILKKKEFSLLYFKKEIKNMLSIVIFVLSVISTRYQLVGELMKIDLLYNNFSQILNILLVQDNFSFTHIVIYNKIVHIPLKKKIS